MLWYSWMVSSISIYQTRCFLNIQLGGGSLTDIFSELLPRNRLSTNALQTPSVPSRSTNTGLSTSRIHSAILGRSYNTSLLIEIMGILLTSKGNNVRLYHSSLSPFLTATFLRRRSLGLLFFSRDRISFKFPYSPKNTSAFTMPLILTTSSFENVYSRHFACSLQISTSPPMR